MPCLGEKLSAPFVRQQARIIGKLIWNKALVDKKIWPTCLYFMTSMFLGNGG